MIFKCIIEKIHPQDKPTLERFLETVCEGSVTIYPAFVGMTEYTIIEVDKEDDGD